MHCRIAILILLLVFSFNLFSQNIRGKVVGVTNSTEEPLPFVTVKWINTSIGAYTDSTGQFKLPLKDITDKRIVVDAFGYLSDTVTVTDNSFIKITLETDVSTLRDIILKSKLIGFDEPIKTEVITKGELAKAACCDLAGCFENQATVQPMTTNIISNSKELRILGLSGVYNQVLIDGMPLIQGLSYTYGISGLPGTLVDNIYVAKGANSVLQGFESISGSINVVLKQPDATDKLLLNAYMNSFWEKHLNANYSRRWKKWSTLAAFHIVQPAGKSDRDNDTFLDLPQLTRYMLYNKWKYRDEDSSGWSSMIGIRYLKEQRTGGQTNFQKSDKGSDTIYGQVISFNQPEVYTKTGYRFDENRKITFIGSGLYLDQNSYFGIINYKARQNSMYGNLQYELGWNYNHQLKAGISVRYLNISEDIAFTRNSDLNRTYAGPYSKNELIPGIFAENVFKWRGDKIALITGARLDHHNKYGLQFTPRTQLKYEVRENTVLRLSAGTGWRTVNIFSENVNLLASSRDVIVTEELKPEKAFNWGINLSQNIDKENFDAILGVDFYQTRFSNQIFPDYDTDPTKAYISNFTGTSVSNGFQAESNFKFYKRFTSKLAYTFLDVFRIENGSKEILPFNPRHKVLGSFSYMPVSKAWHADMNIHWFGKQRLPSTESNPAEFQRPGYSESYTTVNAQFTKTWKKIEVYFGCENIFDFRQKQPILGWQQPFGPYFDSSFAWGPTRGRELYAGLRFKIL